MRPVGTLAGEADTSVPPETSPGPAQPDCARLGVEIAYASRFLVCSACSGWLALFSLQQRRGDGGDGGDGIFRRPGATPAVQLILLLR